jgi:dGTPase
MQELDKDLNENPKYALNKQIATDHVPENCKLYDKLKEIENIKNPKYVLNKEIATDCVLEDCELYNKLKEIEDIYVINNYMINKMNGKSIFVLRQIIKAYLTNPKQLPDRVLESYAKVCSVPTLKELIKHIDSTPQNIRYLNKDIFEDNKGYIIRDRAFLFLISDYIASMTDRYALQEYQKLYGGNSI